MNSIVGGIQRSKAEINNRNRYIDAMGQKLTADTARKINGQLAPDLNSSLNTTMQGVDASVERMMSANNRNQQIDVSAQFLADEARWASRQQGVVDRANGLSASLSSQARALESRYRNQIADIQASADAAFAKGVARGEAMYDAGVRARPQMRIEFNLEAHLAADNAMWGAGKARASAIRSSWDYTKQVVSHVFDPDNLSMIGFRAGDELFTNIVDGTTLVTDPVAIFDLQARTDQVIQQGYLPKGEKLSYRMAKEIYDRGLTDFTLRVDGRELSTIGPMVSPLPFNLDDLKVHGNAQTRNGRIFDGDYDFIDPDTGTLEQRIFPNDKPWKKALTYSRNQLNEIAYSQHSPSGSTYHIEYTYNDNDLVYGRDNFAPWRPDVDPSYASPYEWYLNYQASKRP